MATETITGVSVQNVVELINSTAILVGILAIGFSLVGAVAVWRSGKDAAGAFFRLFEKMQVLQLLTVMLVIASATILALLGILNSNGITGILSGVAGYVLGGLNRGGLQSNTEGNSAAGGSPKAATSVQNGDDAASSPRPEG
jgi:hypothetical protein